jgi:NADPH-dependent 2,4-dienoyl-CoA reductase/sulfur reductase-like enzyme
MTESVVIVGAGQGGYQVAASLRQEGFAGSITLIGDEPGLPYQRPPLSKAYLQGEMGLEQLNLRARTWYEEHRVDLRHIRVTAIDRPRHRLALAEGEPLAYDHLVLATGARNRALALPNADLPNVLGLRTVRDADALATLMGEARRVVVIGAGFIGLEFAAVAVARGLHVTVIELGDRPMARAASQPMSEHARLAHQARGVEFRFGDGVAEIEARGGVATAVVTTAGHRLEADLVLVAIGVVPNTELAAQAGLEVDNGILVQETMRTVDPAVWAIGDAVSFSCAQLQGRQLRLESVQNAVDQARAVAAAIAGRPKPYAALPWFWSDQGDMKLQIAGMSLGHDRCVELLCAQPDQKTVLCFLGERLIAVETINRAADHMAARKLLARDARLTPQEAAASGFDLKAHEAATRASKA